MNALYHLQHDRLPLQICYFAAAYSPTNGFWSDTEQARTYFSHQGHREQFVDAIVSHVESMNGFLRLGQRCVLTGNDIYEIADDEETVNSPIQHHVLQVVGICLEKSDSYYNELNEYEFESNSDMSENDMEEDRPQHYAQSHLENLERQKCIVFEVQYEVHWMTNIRF